MAYDTYLCLPDDVESESTENLKTLIKTMYTMKISLVRLFTLLLIMFRVLQIAFDKNYITSKFLIFVHTYIIVDIRLLFSLVFHYIFNV